MAEAAAIQVKGLGKIEGLCACYTKQTLNGRGYELREVAELLPDSYYGYIYMVVVLDTGNYYIGQHKGIFNPVAPDYWGNGTILNRYKKKYGLDNLRIMCLATAQTPEQLNRLEAQFLGDKYKTDPLCWNLRAGGMVAGFSDDARARLSASLKEHNRIYGSPNKGRKQTDATKAKLSASWSYEKHVTPEMRQKLSDSLKGKPGKPQSEETRKKVSSAASNWWATATEDQKKARNAKISAALHNRTYTAEQRKRISESNKKTKAQRKALGMYEGTRLKKEFQDGSND